MKIKAVIASLLFTGSFAFAEGDPTEFLYQAIEGQSFIQGNLGYLTSQQDQDGGNRELDYTDLELSALYELGLSDKIAVYGSIGFGQGELEIVNIVPTTVDRNGLNPINLGVKYRMKAGPGQFYAQGNLGLGVLAEQDENRTDGSITLATRLGYLMTYDTAMAGLVLDIGLFSTDGKVKDGSDFEKNGAFAISAFYEMVMSEMIVGYAATYSIDAGLAGVSNGGPFGGMFVPDNFETSILDLKVYTRVPMSEKLQLLGGINYGLFMDQPEDFDGGSNIGVNVGVRYMM